ncbi:MAG: SLC13 family permease [Bacillota bacterium]
MTTAIIVFICIYILIVLGTVPRTVAALAGAAIMLGMGIIGPADALKAIDFDTVGLLAGMMIIVGITRTSGIFECLAIKAAKVARGEPVRILSALSLITAVLSAFLDNVTTVMLILPVTFAIAGRLRITPVPFLMAIIISSNIGGTATLVGDPPNIMISGFTGLGFMDFLTNLTPAVIVIYIITVVIMKYIFREQMITFPSLKDRVIRLKASEQITNKVLLYKCLFVLIITVAGFVFHQYTKLEPAFIAVVGAALLAMITRNSPVNALKYVEWSVILFFIGLFVIVGALDKSGVIERLAVAYLDITGGNVFYTAITILWFSAIFSAFIDNIPLVASMIPLIIDLGNLGGINDLTFFWWSLSLGSCLGGNGTIIGASANVVVIGMAEKRGIHISFVNFMKTAFPLMLLSIVISTVYLAFWYFIKAC